MPFHHALHLPRFYRYCTKPILILVRRHAASTSFQGYLHLKWSNLTTLKCYTFPNSQEYLQLTNKCGSALLHLPTFLGYIHLLSHLSEKCSAAPTLISKGIYNLRRSVWTLHLLLSFRVDTPKDEPTKSKNGCIHH